MSETLYQGYHIKTRKNGDKWDYVIPGLTTEGYTGRRWLYDSQAIALKRAKKRIDFHEESLK